MNIELTDCEVQAITWLLQAQLNVQGASDEQLRDFYHAKMSLREKIGPPGSLKAATEFPTVEDS